ncbi:glycosyl transferase GT2 family [Methanobrevibacter ruminantium M1]|uniref:Glycosyl transferase GT2 family n=1 Tax=Methanobrevibacter ruminantium (strain ATCC 35063 / DSM 1093 / JCM 13430 / OCM 146 / M1) TaxID=634498 RepID=D3E304_METRM|nr:glycosyltransferase family 2 protein [Methanobrevibacter ruminantium]ADC46915.1 glycosyl transferase GT2 family [Methanobrevibacter ruminantium M1]
MTYKVSIIIPVYNAAEFIIRDTLKSIENQTMDFEDIEVILVNDCSTDNTAKVINEYAKEHENIVPINLKENNGQPGIPRNIGITYASADYLMFLDQDDTFKKNACETLYNKISTENVDMVCGNHNIVSNGRSNICFNFDWAEEDEIKINKIDENPNFLTMGVAAWSKILRREFVLDNNLKFTEGVGEDIFFSIRALLLAEGIILLKNFIVVDYLVRGESLSHQVNAEYLDEFCEFYLNFFNYCEKNIKNDNLYHPLFNGRLNHVLSMLFFADLYFDDLSWVLIKIHELFKKVAEKPFVFEDTSYRIFFDTLIKDEYPFENSINIYSAIKSNRERKFDKGVKYLEQEAKLYIDNGNGFNEKDSIIANYKIYEFNEVEFNLENFKNIKRIRFDPITWNFINCVIHEIKTNNGDLLYEAINSINRRELYGLNKEEQSSNRNSKENIRYKSSDDSSAEGIADIFLTTDSQYLLYGDFNNLKSIKINFEVNLIDNNEVSKIVENLIENYDH